MTRPMPLPVPESTAREHSLPTPRHPGLHARRGVDDATITLAPPFVHARCLRAHGIMAAGSCCGRTIVPAFVQIRATLYSYTSYPLLYATLYTAHSHTTPCTPP
ncbi:hypothetical protein L226DRAFT_537489 [Lentinus tigrinus ALCF2SS1-7]|uniref:uncharacterized protein n=1 Tax=Lentinus tigrinus ALCF2SS1-7 TaxID=1328758 RepID=UPI0011662B85|nr:hypothetical protein L226DRAFT_537489 [Lentinus tigrinus ALCF2SS1-7]